MPGSVINLNQQRKLREKAAEVASAAQNRTRFGRTKAEKRRDAQKQLESAAFLDAHRLDRERPES